MKIRICTCFMVFSAIFGWGADFDLGSHGKLSIAVPKDWIVTGRAADAPGVAPVGYAFSFKPRGDANAKCLLTFVYQAHGVTNREAIREEVLRLTKRFVSESVENKQTLKEFSFEPGYGVYCVFTDSSLVGKKPEPGEYKVMGSGRVQLSNEVGAVVSLFADDADGQDMRTMVNIINSLKLRPTETK